MRVTENLQPELVQAKPFPLLVARNVLDDKYVHELLQELPPLEVMLKGVPYGSNERVNFQAADILSNPSIAPIWKDTIGAHLEKPFLDDIIRLFGSYIPQYYPDFESRFAQLDKLKVGVRDGNPDPDAHVLLDAQIAVNTPADMGGTSVRGPHVDCPKKLFVGLFYLRLDGDQSRGGDLVIYRAKSKPVKFDSTRTVDVTDMEVVQKVNYEKNVLVLFLNTPDSLHGVTVRSSTSYHRVFLNLLGEMRTPLFQLETCKDELADYVAPRVPVGFVLD